MPTSKYTNMSAFFEEKHELMPMAFPSRVTRLDGKTKMNTTLRLNMNIRW
jgi:hypothetical protein